ncbi:hypothetical protein Hanom_Chr01g00068871 [Helianthus anomalus]
MNNRPATEPNQTGEKGDRSFTHHDLYRDLEKLDFMTAAKILFTTPPKQKKFGYVFFVFDYIQFLGKLLPWF